MDLYKIGFIAVPVVAMIGWSSPERKEQPAAAAMAKIMAPVLPKSLAGGGTIVSAKADGDLLVLTVDLPGDTGWTTEELEKMASAGFCQTGSAEGYFAKGGRVRFDISTDGGSVSAGTALERC